MAKKEKMTTGEKVVVALYGVGMLLIGFFGGTGGGSRHCCPDCGSSVDYNDRECPDCGAYI